MLISCTVFYMPMRFFVKILSLLLFFSVIQATQAQGAGNSLTLKVEQSGESAKLTVLWSIIGSVEGSKISVIDSKGKTINNYLISAKLSYGGRKGFKEFIVKDPGKYIVKLSRTKGGKFSLTKNFAVIGLNPTKIDALTIGNEGVRVEWSISSLDTFRKVDSFLITIYQNSLTYKFSSVGDSNYLLIDTKSVKLDGFNVLESFDIGITAINKAGSSLEYLVKQKYGDSTLFVLEKSLMTQEKAGEIFGGFAILNRGSIGVVNFNDSVQTAKFPVPFALTKCLSESSGVSFTGEANLGGVFASRSPGLVFLITSGASWFKDRLNLDTLQKDNIFLNCIKAPLNTQANLIADTLAPGSAVRDLGFVVGPELITNTFSFTLDGVYDKDIPIRLTWSVKYSSEGALVQYIYIKSGVGVDTSSTRYFEFLKA